jgi:hypothetical protein
MLLHLLEALVERYLKGAIWSVLALEYATFLIYFW